MRFRKLRIAWTVTCGIVCVLLTVLWVRSYRVSEDWRCANGTTLLNIQSYRGELGIGRWPFPKPIPWRYSNERIGEESAERLWPPMKDQAPLSYLGIRWQTMPPLNLFAVRYWFPVVLFAALSVVPWLSRWSGRFSYVGACQV